MSFICWLPLTLTGTLLLLELDREVNYDFLMSDKRKDGDSSLTLHKSCFACYFGIMRHFFAKIFNGVKKPFQFVLFCNRLYVQILPKGPRFTFCDTMRLTRILNKIRRSFELLFSSFGYCRKEYLTL